MLRKQSFLQTVFLQAGPALAPCALGGRAWAQEAPPTADSCVFREVAGATFGTNDDTSFPGGDVADCPVNAGPRLSF